MKGSSKKIAIGVAIAIVIIAGIVGFSISRNSNKTNDNDDTPVISYDNNKDANGNDIITVDDDGKINYSYQNEYLIAAQEYMNTYNHLYLEFLETEDIQYEDGTVDSKLLKRYLSEIYLNEKTNDTKDLTNYTSDQDYDKVPMVDFEKVFGFDNTEYNKAFDLTMAFIKNQGFNLDFDNAALNEDIFEQYGERVYVLNGESPIFDTIIADIDYDEILGTGCNYVIAKDNTGNWALHYINICVEYAKDDAKITKTVECIVDPIIDDPEYLSGCGCNSNADCNTGENNGVNCETDCEMDEPINN